MNTKLEIEVLKTEVRMLAEVKYNSTGDEYARRIIEILDKHDSKSYGADALLSQNARDVIRILRERGA